MTGTLIRDLITTSERLDFNQAWDEAHNRQCEFTRIDSLQLCGWRCGGTIQAHEYQHVRFCELHTQEEI